MDKIVIQVNENKKDFYRKVFIILVISSCANMHCPAYKICSEQPTGPVCTCTGNKIGTFCQYGKSKNELSDMYLRFLLLFR
jgi:hypothetical protein